LPSASPTPLGMRDGSKSAISGSTGWSAKVPGLAGVTQLAAGLEESMALRSDGTLLVWGWENFGLRGDGIPRFSKLPAPTPVTAVSGVTRITMAGNTVLVLASG
jgi:alpha-tubulin suppressor-like RCC1 family protein